MKLKRVLMSQKKQVDYVLSVSERIKAVHRLNNYYRSVISDKATVMRFISCFKDYAIECSSIEQFTEYRNSKTSFYNKLRQNKTLKSAVMTIHDYNMKAEAYSRAYNNIFEEYSNEFNYDENIISYQNFCKIESQFLRGSFQLPIMNFSIHSIVSYSDIYSMKNYKFHVSLTQTELLNIYGIYDCVFNGVAIDTVMSNNTCLSGCYVLFNKTMRRFYIGYADNVYKTINMWFHDNSSELYAEKLNGCEFFVHVVEMKDITDKSISDTVNYLSWCYNNSDDIVINTLTPVKERRFVG